jgi:hypothetical protein
MSAASTIRNLAIAGASLVWGGAIVYGARILLQYENAPGEPGKPPVSWPSLSRIERQAGRYSLVLLAHPDCPCTRASIAGLERLATRLPGKLDMAVIFRKPGAGAEEVRASSLWKRAAAVPGVRVSHDGSGDETRRFGALVSGQTALYDGEGRLVFSGGLTRARGHEGASPGEDLVISAVTGAGTQSGHAPVFGCALNDPGEKQLREEPSWKRR